MEDNKNKDNKENKAEDLGSLKEKLRQDLINEFNQAKGQGANGEKKPKNKKKSHSEEEKKIINEVYSKLEGVIDPELNIDIVNLGLVYDVYFTTDDWLKIDVTLTTPLCPLTDEIEKQIANSLEGVVLKFEINWVWEPAWNMSMISDLGKEALSSLGYNFH